VLPPVFRSILYSVSVPVDADHARLICELETALAVRLVG
jgi:hypothetical protein